MLRVLKCSIQHTIDVSEFSKSLLYHVLHQQLCLGHSNFEKQLLRVPSVRIVRASDTDRVRLHVHHPPRKVLR